jgi:hypothetical protein
MLEIDEFSALLMDILRVLLCALPLELAANLHSGHYPLAIPKQLPLLPVFSL